MAISFRCPHCGVDFAVPDGSAGKTAPCPGCQKLVNMPERGRPVLVIPKRPGAGRPAAAAPASPASSAVPSATSEPALRPAKVACRPAAAAPHPKLDQPIQPTEPADSATDQPPEPPPDTWAPDDSAKRRTLVFLGIAGMIVVLIAGCFLLFGNKLGLRNASISRTPVPPANASAQSSKPSNTPSLAARLMATSRRQRVPANPGQPASPDDRAAVPTGPGQASPPTAGPVPPAVTRPGGRIPDNRILTVAELTGTWRIQEKPAWELEVGSRSGLDLARLYLYADDGSMTELPLREISSAGGELQCQYQSGGRSGRATFRQDPQGGIQFALDAEAPAPLIRAECALVAKELNGSWAPSGGIISELVFEGDSLVNFGGTLIRTDAGTFKEGAIRRAFQTGRKLNLQVQWDEGPGTANLVLLKRLDGTFYVAHPAALDSSGLRYYRLNPVDEPSSPLTANDLKASWQTARLSLLSFRTAGNVLGGELVARADRRFKGEINSVVFHGNRAALKWTYLAVSGAGSVRRQADGLLSVRLETDNVTWGGSVQMKQRETVKKMFADGAWYALQEYQAPPIPTNKPVEVALVRPDQHGLRVQAVGFPAGARCEIALRSGDPSLAKQITPEFADTFKTGTTLELEAPDTVGKRLFDRWEEADETKGTKAWISNNIDHVVVARYKGWQGTWKTENGKTFIVTQSGTRISAATPDASARFSGQLERQNSEEVLRGLWDDAYSYDLVAVLSADGQSFTGMKRRRAAASSSISTAFPAENLAARREE